MNLITTKALTMSSQEIADLVNARHDSVKRTIERLSEKGAIQLPPLVEVKNHLGQTVEQYVFSGEKGKRDSFVVVAQLSPEFTGALVDRWQELEGRPRVMLPEDLPGALRLAADLAEQKAALALENQQQAKKIEALEHLFMPGETVPQFAKRLNGVNSQLMLTFLLENKWIFNAERDPERSIKYRVYYIAREKHWLTEKPVTVSGEGIKSFIKYAPVMLEEGTKKLFDLYIAEKLPMKKTWDGQFFYEKFNPETPL
ncbi:Rha family transcriptional regulator [Pseudomonas typographi]|uniref:Phage antirepressor protein n=1 Tax=Pseudomonas typographi TaxID=2715964 RepID=A0ABR7YZG1_9PSED|nr:Rha family transcriptional regulator [Pseudomonas typographi]MBD1586716.1 phage antirepressor protein [Pseudomonas typographi]MBD1598609.1 phage antirepressor protein [Pseudomonas typographi]